MIRRDATDDAGRPGWLLIHQIEHARVAVELATDWDAPGGLPLLQVDQLLPAIRHHDDGWHAWDTAPGIDPVHCRPRDFLEMELADSLAIWSQSIDVCAGWGPLAGFAVGRHFMRLLDHSNHARYTRAESELAADFRRRQQAAQQSRATACASTLGMTNEAIELAAEHLSFFDLLSLWLCCQQRAEPRSFALPGSTTQLTLAPEGPLRFRVAPWPWQAAQWAVEATAYWVPQAPYVSTGELLCARHGPCHLRWELNP